MKYSYGLAGSAVLIWESEGWGREGRSWKFFAGHRILRLQPKELESACVWKHILWILYSRQLNQESREMIENWAIPHPCLSSLTVTLLLVSQMLSLFVKHLTQYTIELPGFPLSTLFPLKHYQLSPEMMNLCKGGLCEYLCSHCGWEEGNSKL